MKVLTVYECVFGKIDLCSKQEIAENLALIDIVTGLSSAAIDTLHAAFKAGPLYDGDVPSKSGRDELLSHGLVGKTITKGEWGFNACTYRGAWAIKVLDAINGTQPKSSAV